VRRRDWSAHDAWGLGSGGHAQPPDLDGHTWREIGDALGVSKQAAFQRFGKDWIVASRSTLPGEFKRTVRRALG
jgi:hypothetical protein